MGILSGWAFRKTITITGTSAGAQTNYQMNITVNAGAGTDSSSNIFLNSKGSFTDFRDVRFTQSDGSTLLNHWFETGTLVVGTSVLAWVQINSIPASPSTTTIYIYYGNGSAADASNGGNTFPVFFDDFPGSSIDTGKWSGNTGSATVSGSICTLTTSSVWQTIQTIAQSFSQPHAFRARISWISSNASTRMDWGASVTAGTDYMIYDEFTDGTQKIRATASSTGTITASSWTTGAYHVYEIKWRTNEAIYTQDDVAVTGSPITTNVPSANMGITIDVWTNSGNKSHLSDWHLVREYASPEPTFDGIGVEESICVTVTPYIYHNP